MSYKRVTERERPWQYEEFWGHACEPSDVEIDEVYNRLAELEDKLESGTLINTGEPVYRFFRGGNGRSFYIEALPLGYVFRTLEQAEVKCDELNKRLEEVYK